MHKGSRRRRGERAPASCRAPWDRREPRWRRRPRRRARCGSRAQAPRAHATRLELRPQARLFLDRPAGELLNFQKDDAGKGPQPRSFGSSGSKKDLRSYPLLIPCAYNLPPEIRRLGRNGSNRTLTAHDRAQSVKPRAGIRGIRRRQAGEAFSGRRPTPSLSSPRAKHHRASFHADLERRRFMYMIKGACQEMCSPA